MPDPRFHTTQWTLVFTAAADDENSRPALEELCARYWFPVYVFIRRQGYDAAEAEDLTQGFYTKLIEKAYLAQVDRNRGKFRTFLLASVKHFLSNERDRVRAQKRGGGAAHKTLDLTGAEERYAGEQSGLLSPDEMFEKRCALSLLDAALRQLREEYVERDDLRHYDALAPLLTGESPELYAKVADDLGMSRGALRVALHRMRGRFRTIVREHVSALVAAPDQVDEEIRHLMNAVTM
jgi:RNA polymerase sigma-70 factor (ECF subfamily)